MKRNIHIPLSAAALTLLLAACGGGGGSGDKTVSSSPDASSAANVVVNTNTTAGSGSESGAGASAGTNSGNTGTASNPAGTGSTSGSGNTSASNNTSTTDVATQTAASTNPQASLPTANVSNTPTEVPLISDKGVRGDVLLAMFEQRRCGASTTPSTTYDGPRLAESDTPPVRFNARLEASNYTVDPNDWSPADTFVQQECRREVYRPVSPGTYPYNIDTAYQYERIREKPLYGYSGIKRGFNAVRISYTLTVVDGSFEIGPNVTVISQQDLGPTAPPEVFQNGQSFENNGPTDNPYFAPIDAMSIDLKSEVSFGTLREWNQRRWAADNTPSYLRLMLIKSDVPNQAKLCSNVSVNYVKRLVCTVWNIPQNWKWGQQLEYVDGYIVDDRTAYANETGMLYWRNTQPN